MSARPSADSDQFPRVVPLKVEDFESFYRQHSEKLMRALIASVGDPTSAHDALSEGFARAYERWDKVRGARNPAGWVYRVSMNWAISQRRKRKPIVRSGAVDQPFSDRLPDTSLEKALLTLPLEQRAVLVLKYLMEWTQPEIADALAVPVGTVKSRTSRALERLRGEYEKKQQ